MRHNHQFDKCCCSPGLWGTWWLLGLQDLAELGCCSLVGVTMPDGPSPLPAFHCPRTCSQRSLSTYFGIGEVCYSICVSQNSRELQSWSNNSFLEHIPAGPMGPCAQAHTHICSEVAVSAKAKSSFEGFGCQENGDFQLW